MEISNEFGSESCSVEITIDFEEPKFITPLKDKNVSPNENVTLECTYRGLPKPEAKWLVSGLLVADSDKYRIQSEQVDKKVSKTSLEIVNISLDDCEMEYTCKALNVMGEAMTQAKLLPQGLFNIHYSPSSDLSPIVKAAASPNMDVLVATQAPPPQRVPLFAILFRVWLAQRLVSNTSLYLMAVFKIWQNKQR